MIISKKMTAINITYITYIADTGIKLQAGNSVSGEHKDARNLKRKVVHIETPLPIQVGSRMERVHFLLMMTSRI